MLNSISVDVEDYYHATNIEQVIPAKHWHSLESRVDYSTRTILELFQKHNIRATFFILGCVARKIPELVKSIAQCGHEIGSHGYAHRLAYQQSQEAFRRDVYRSKQLLEDITGQRILGYRAPNFSIVNQNQWAYDVLLNTGYIYDSSVYPIVHPRYTNISKPRSAYLVKRDSGTLVVFPLAVTAITAFNREIRFPVAGGAYWRLLPFWYIRWGLRRMNNKENLPANCYIHPWEVDYNQPRFKELSRLSRLRHYGGIRGLPDRLNSLFKEFKFCALQDIGAKCYPDLFTGNESAN